MSLSSGILRCGRHAAQEARAMAGGARRAASCRDQIVAGPVSISPPDWICPLLAIEWWHAEGRGDLRRRATSHDISNVLSTAPHRFNSRKPNGDVDAHPWCEGFHAAMRPRLLAWAPLLDLGNINHGLLLPILVHCVDDQGRPL